MSAGGLWAALQRYLPKRDTEAVLRQGDSAGVWLKDETLNAALAEIRAGTIEGWSISRDPESRERAWLTIQAVNLFAESLNKMLEQATVEREILRRQQSS